MENEKQMVKETQLEKMEHAIGFRFDRIKKNKYVAYRNYFAAPLVDDEDWKWLVGMGYAEQGEVTQSGIFYHVTRAGMDFIERVTGIKIIEED